MKKTKIKLRSSLSYNNFIMCFVVFVVVLIICWAFSPFGIEWLYGFLIALGIALIPLILALIQFCFFRPYYLVDNKEIKKYKRRKLVLTVKREEIKEILCVKTSFKYKLLFPLWFILVDFPGDKICIKFQNENEEFDYGVESSYGLGTRNEDYKINLKSNTDLLSKKCTYKLAKILNIDVH